MTVRKLDPDTGDIATSGVTFLSGDLEVAQTVKTRLRLFLGEYFRDITDGTDWFGSILSKTTALSAKDAIIRRRIIQTEGVVGITRYRSTFDESTRTFSIDAEILTTDGVIEIREFEGVTA